MAEIIFIVCLVLYVLDNSITSSEKQKIKKDIEQLTLFEDLKDYGFISDDKEEHLLEKWYLKEDKVFSYNCNFNVGKESITFELIIGFNAILEEKRISLRYQYWDFRKKYKEQNLWLGRNRLVKVYKISQISDLPTAKEINTTFEQMIEVIKSEKPIYNSIIFHLPKSI